MASADDYAAWIVKNQDKKGSPEFATVAAAYQQAKSETAEPRISAEDQKMIDEYRLGNPFQQVAAGWGKSLVDTGRRLRQAVTLNSPESQAAIDESKVTDAPLMRSGWGIAGNVAGNLSQMVGPAAAIGAAGKALQLPGMVTAASSLIAPKSILGAAGVGAGMGALEPVASGDSTFKNMGVGALGGAVVPGAIAAGGLVKDLASPFFKSGQQSLAARTFERFAADPNAIKNADTRQLVPGSLPTLAEATQDPGLAQLQRTLRNNPDANNAITNRMLSNQDARLGALQDIAGEPGKREFYAASRESAANDLYKQAFDQSPQMTPWIKGEISKLQKRPAFNDAFDRAATLAANEGVELNPSNAVQVLHYTKMALDSEISKAARAGDNQAIKGLMDTKGKLVSLIESKNVSPPYAEARNTFSAMSRPINQMDVGQHLTNQLQPALAEFGATGRLTPQKYAQAVRNADQTAKTATGFSGAKMENILDPQQWGTVQNIAKDLGRSANAQGLGMAQGSPTMQNLVGQDILRQTLGPLGLPKGWAEAALPNQLLKATNLAYSGPQERVMGLLGQLSLDPEAAKRLLAKELARRAKVGKYEQYVPLSVSPGTAGLLGLSQ